MAMNLIKNSEWCPGPNGGPEFFSGQIATYDDLCINGYRTCSITQTTGMDGYDQYDLPVQVEGRRCIEWGYMIRRADADQIVLRADFFNGSNMMIAQGTEDITACVGHEFERHMAKFGIPRGARYVRLSMHFYGKITACTFYAPMAYYC